MKLRKKFRLEPPSDKVELYSSSGLDHVNKKGKERKKQKKEIKEGILCSWRRFIFYG